MALGRKTGGRQAGTPNRRTVTIQQKLEALGCCLFTLMADIAMDKTQPVTVRAQMAKELGEYCAPKRKSAHLFGPTIIEQPLPPFFDEIMGDWRDEN
jgi:hypothetical protein